MCYHAHPDDIMLTRDEPMVNPNIFLKALKQKIERRFIVYALS